MLATCNCVVASFSKDSRLPEQLQRAMAAEAEAARDARAKIIKADGERKATAFLRDAAHVLAQSPAALQLRYLQVKQKEPTIVLTSKFGICGRSLLNSHDISLLQKPKLISLLHYAKFIRYFLSSQSYVFSSTAKFMS